MASQIDFIIAVGLFFTFIAVLVLYLLNYITNYTGVSSISELSTVAYNLYTSLFADKGIPRNWTDSGEAPLKIGIAADMYRIPVVVVENSSTNRGLVTLNLSLTFDPTCDNRAWNNSVRVINSTNHSMPIQLYNQTVCRQQYLRTADIVFNSSFNAGESKNFSIYFSHDKNITGSNNSMAFPSLTNFTFTIYPEETFKIISVERLNALRRLNYSEILNTISKEYYFNVEIGQ